MTGVSSTYDRSTMFFVRLVVISIMRWHRSNATTYRFLCELHFLFLFGREKKDFGRWRAGGLGLWSAVLCSLYTCTGRRGRARAVVVDAQCQSPIMSAGRALPVCRAKKGYRHASPSVSGEDVIKFVPPVISFSLLILWFHYCDFALVVFFF